MKILYLEPVMGAAGDMINACLYELLTDEQKQAYLDRMNGLLEGVTVTPEKAVKGGISGTHMDVAVEANLHHSHMKDIREKISGMGFSRKVEKDIIEIYGIIADAESKVHGFAVEEIHFHEVGDKDAIIDIAGAAMLMDMIGPDRVVSCTVTTGYGTVKCAHGMLPVPAPAAAEILTGMPVKAGDVEGELCTPTGAAILKYYADDFGGMPAMEIEAIGHGMGRKDFERPNMLRAYLGTRIAARPEVVELVCNIDDMTGEELGYAAEKIMQGKALDVYMESIMMKKGRPGIRLSVICREEDRDAVAGDIFFNTRTIGLREYMCTRYEMERDTEQRNGMRIKKAAGFGVAREKTEFEDRAAEAERKGSPVTDVK